MKNMTKHIAAEDYKVFQFYPFNSVVGFIQQEEDAEAAVNALYTHGYTGDMIGILYGEYGARVLDSTGKENGLMGRVARGLQNISDQETDLLRRSDQLLREGYYLFRVRTDGSRDAMEAVRAVLRQWGSVVITFYHSGGTEIVDA